MSFLKLGVIARSGKENERRLPLHPDHFHQIPPQLRRAMLFERGYGEPFGVSDEALSELFGGLADRDELLRDCDIVLLPKPLPGDLRAMRKGGILWGWPHCVQQPEITQIAINRKQTLLAWEAMFTWKRGGTPELHLFHRNNEMAGYCGVFHALEIAGLDGYYGPDLHAVVLSMGSVSRGAIYALRSRGIARIRVYTQRAPRAVHDQVIGCGYGQMLAGTGDSGMVVIEEDGDRRPLVEVLAESDLIVNGILQNTDHPLMFLRESEEIKLKRGSLIIDISSDLKMGFPFARPTSFEKPTIDLNGVLYYGVDHTPSYLWRSATWEISRVVVAYLEAVAGGPSQWEKDETLQRAVEIRDGIVQNPKILRFQKRSEQYPHLVDEC